MSELTYSQALDIVRNQKNHYAAFARLEEILELATSGVGQADTLRRNIATLQKEHAAAEEKKRLLDGAVDSAHTTLTATNAKLADARREYDALSDRSLTLNRELATTRGAIDTARADLTSALEQARREHGEHLEAADQEYRTRVQAHEEAFRSLQARAQATLDNLRESAGTVTREIEKKRGEFQELQRATEDVRELLEVLHRTANPPPSQ